MSRLSTAGCLLAVGLALSSCAETARVAIGAVQEARARRAEQGADVRRISGAGSHEVSGELAAGDTRLGSGQYYDRYEVEVADGQSLRVEMSSGNGVPDIVALGPDDTRFDAVTGSDGTAVLEIAGPAVGTWRIGATTERVVQACPYHLTVSLLEVTSVTVPDPPRVLGTTRFDDEYNQCTDDECRYDVEALARAEMERLLQTWREQAESAAERRRVDAAQRAWVESSSQHCLDQTSETFGGATGGTTINQFYSDCEFGQLTLRVERLATQRP